MPKRAEVSGIADAVTDEESVTEDSPTTTLVGAGADSTGVVTTAALLGLGSLLICLDATSSDTAETTTGATAGVVVAVVESTEVAADEVLDVLTILSDYTHISSVFLSSF
jgi:hypothetical protein